MSQPNLTEDLNIVSNSNLEITLLDGDLNIIQALDDEPNDVGGLTSSELKAKFDEAGNTIKTYINGTLIPEILTEEATEAARAAAEAQREANENQRIENENARIAAEQARTTAESARADAETERAAAESARNTAEQAREAAEQARADETAGIVAQATEQAVIASNAASEASSSASGASTSASAAASSASSASDSASASASSAAAAQASAAEALSSKNSAKSEADRAKSEADRAAEIAGEDFVKSSEKGAAGGVATLGADALLAVAQRPKAGGLYRDDGTTTVEESLTEISTTLQDVYTKDEVDTFLQNIQTAVLNVTTNAGVVVTATNGSKVLSATADSSGLAVLYPDKFGTWTVSGSVGGIFTSIDYEIKAIAQYELAFFPDLETVSWDVINSISESGIASSIWSVGDKKTVAIDGVNYQVQIIGFDHDTKTSGGKAGITFQMVDCLNSKYQMNSSSTNAGGWTSCAMRSSTMSTLLTKLPSALQNVIKAVNKLTSAGNQSATINTTSDKLFLLSEVEIYGSTKHSKSGEGSQYAYYKAGNSKVKKVNGSASHWWERSPRGSNSTGFCLAESGGDAGTLGASTSEGVSFAFCI